MWRTRSLFRTTRRTFFFKNQGAQAEMKPDFYYMLGIGKDATDKEIKLAYFEKAKTHHPDVVGENNTQFDFEQINEAYQTLKDPKKRRMYNLTGLSSEEQGDGYGSSFQEEANREREIREEEAGNMFQKYVKIFKYELSAFEEYINQGIDAINEEGEPLKREFDYDPNVSYNITVCFKELKGVMKRTNPDDLYLSRRVTYSRQVLWPDCQGNLNKKNSQIYDCEPWQGRGNVVGGSGFGLKLYTCTECQGTGKVIPSPWYTWDAKGTISRQERLILKIPAGMKNGEYMRINNKGNMLPDGSYGDLFVRVNISGVPEDFEIRGYDIISTHKVPIGKTVVDSEEHFKTIYGVVSSKIPSELGPESKFEIEGYGLPIPNSNGRKGKHIFNIEYEMP